MPIKALQCFDNGLASFDTGRATRATELTIGHSAVEPDKLAIAIQGVRPNDLGETERCFDGVHCGFVAVRHFTFHFVFFR